MTPERARELVSNFNIQVLVVGDVMLDKFVWGDVNRFSPEFPSCRVLDHIRETKMLGGAGNSAANLGTLGAKCVRLVGLYGYDDAGKDLKWMMSQDLGPVDNQLCTSHERPTTVKARFVSQADGAHLLRCDKESTLPASATENNMLFSTIRRWSSVVSGIVVEDYGKGVVTPALLRLVSSISKERNIPVFIDPKKDHWEHFKGAELIKPNEQEAFAALGLTVGSCPIEEVGEKLLKYTRAKAVIITRGAVGMSLFTEGTSLCVPPTPTPIVDTSGAGDTTMSTLALARMAGADWSEAMELANAAAGIAVGKPGTATVSSVELLSRYGDEKCVVP